MHFSRPIRIRRFARSLAGFTLIELMIVVAIVAILASVAYPAYTSQVRKSRRADAETVLLQAEQYMQRYYATSSSGYTGADLANPGLTASPVGATGSQKYYDISVEIPDDGQSYTLSATPTQTGDPCGTLTLTSTGAKGQASGATTSQCWQ